MKTSERKQVIKQLSDAVKQYINPKQDSRVYWAREVTFDYAGSHAIRVDFMKFKPMNNSVSGIEKGDFYCFEVKSGIDDFYSGHGHNFIGDFNYYVMTEETYQAVKKKEIQYGIGVLVPDGAGSLKSIRAARRRNRTHSIAEMLLMMFRSVARNRLSET